MGIGEWKIFSVYKPSKREICTFSKKQDSVYIHELTCEARVTAVVWSLHQLCKNIE